MIYGKFGAIQKKYVSLFRKVISIQIIHYLREIICFGRAQHKYFNGTQNKLICSMKGRFRLLISMDSPFKKTGSISFTC